jgi:hypothetical protein
MARDGHGGRLQPRITCDSPPLECGSDQSGEEFVSIARSRLVTVLAACLTAAACGSSQTAGTSAPPATATPDQAAAAARCQQLEQRHVSPCPPATLPQERIAIRNGTGGKVPDDQVREQGLSYLRMHALYVWAVKQADGDRFLTSGAIAPPEVGRTNLYGTEVRLFASARAAGGRARVQTLTTTEITLVPVPQALQDVARQDGLTPSAYAWVDNQAGPGRGWIEAPDGSTRDVVRIPDGQPHPILVFGQVKDDPELGAIWFQGGEFGCLSEPKVRTACGM